MDEEAMRVAGMKAGHVRLLQKHLASRRADAPTAKAAPPTAAAASQALVPVLEGPAAGLQTLAPVVEAVQSAEQLLQIVPAVLTRPPTESASKPVSDLLERARADFREQKAARAAEAGAAGAAEEPVQRRAQSSVPKEAEVRYIAALRAARAAVAEPDAAGPDDTLMALAQLAEESAQLVATAASFCAWPQADPRQLAAVVDSAQQAAQRAQWAAVAAVASGESADHDKEWSQKMRRAAVQAAEVAEQYARDCAKAATSTGRPQAVARAFCKFHTEGRCLKGPTCEFSHDVGVLPTLPLANKLELPCCFFAKGQCNRGANCPYPHGEEELTEVIRLKQAQMVPAATI
uniref:C3H1-type domain-containing protein n=1 Tax=Alexandrium catenella TaxID=2925 RepID=A0A7S1SBP3_ALECA|mmetsp:Transcript_94551/g.251144  ORF Transcript_94551/g.251144 Transcript_94551/m.251144 type:complete len:347 (+) Transcript_94551:1-1041(+)